MLVTDQVLFIHAPKTGGLSMTDFLIANLAGPKILTVPSGHADPAPGLTVVEGLRHEHLGQAEQRLAALGRSLSSFQAILAIIRNPYDLEVSRYHYYRRGHEYDKGWAQDVALSGDFDRFCRTVGYPWGFFTPIEKFYSINGVIPPNMRLLRLEALDEDVHAALNGICEIKEPLGNENRTMHREWRHYITIENEPFLFAKYRWMFQFYPRWDPVTRSTTPVPPMLEPRSLFGPPGEVAPR